MAQAFTVSLLQRLWTLPQALLTIFDRLAQFGVVECHTAVAGISRGRWGARFAIGWWGGGRPGSAASETLRLLSSFLLERQTRVTDQQQFRVNTQTLFSTAAAGLEERR